MIFPRQILLDKKKKESRVCILQLIKKGLKNKLTLMSRLICVFNYIIKWNWTQTNFHIPESLTEAEDVIFEFGDKKLMKSKQDHLKHKAFEHDFLRRSIENLNICFVSSFTHPFFIIRKKNRESVYSIIRKCLKSKPTLKCRFLCVFNYIIKYNTTS